MLNGKNTSCSDQRLRLRVNHLQAPIRDRIITEEPQDKRSFSCLFLHLLQPSCAILSLYGADTPGTIYLTDPLLSRCHSSNAQSMLHPPLPVRPPEEARSDRAFCLEDLAVVVDKN